MLRKKGGDVEVQNGIQRCQQGGLDALVGYGVGYGSLVGVKASSLHHLHLSLQLTPRSPAVVLGAVIELCAL